MHGDCLSRAETVDDDPGIGADSLDPVLFTSAFNDLKFARAQAQFTAGYLGHVTHLDGLKDRSPAEVIGVALQHHSVHGDVFIVHERAGSHWMGLEGVVSHRLDRYLRDDEPPSIVSHLRQKEHGREGLFQGDLHGIVAYGLEAHPNVLPCVGGTVRIGSLGEGVDDILRGQLVASVTVPWVDHDPMFEFEGPHPPPVRGLWNLHSKVGFKDRDVSGFVADKPVEHHVDYGTIRGSCRAMRIECAQILCVQGDA